VCYPFLGSQKNQNFTKEQIEELAKEELNRRQIRNIPKTVQLLATSRQVPLDFGHARTIKKLRTASVCIPVKTK
jgi:hypothetical protein